MRSTISPVLATSREKNSSAKASFSVWIHASLAWSCRGRKLGFHHVAAAWYSWMRPLRTSRRRTSSAWRWVEERRVRGSQIEPAMGTVGVVVADIGVQEAIEMPTAQDERPVKELGSNRPHPSLSEGVGLRGSDRGEDHPGPFGLEHLVEGAGELLIAVADEEAHRWLGFVTIEGEVPRLLGEEGTVRVGGGAGDVHAPCPDLDEEQDVERLQEGGLHREEVAGEDPRCLSAQELRPAGAVPSRSGPEA